MPAQQLPNHRIAELLNQAFTCLSFSPSSSLPDGDIILNRIQMRAIEDMVGSGGTKASIKRLHQAIKPTIQLQKL